MFEDKAPEQKLVTDGEIFIKHLVKKQKRINISLHEHLHKEKEFYKATELDSVTNYTSGQNTLHELQKISLHLKEIETLKSFDLSQEEIDLYLKSKQGDDHLVKQYKHVNKEVIHEKLNYIKEKLAKNVPWKITNTQPINRLKEECMLSAKPDSIETKLLKFALQNGQVNQQQLPHPIDNIRDLESQLFPKNNESINVKKIRKKARRLGKVIELPINNVLKEPISKIDKSYSYAKQSKWDQKNNEHIHFFKPSCSKIYTCNKPPVLYTIKNGEIMKLENSHTETLDSTIAQLNEEEIIQIPKFQNYNKGEPSQTIFLKNLSNGVDELVLKNIFHDIPDIKSIKVMKGKMRGQAFIEFESLETSIKAIERINGKIIKNKPLIAIFGKRK